MIEMGYSQQTKQWKMLERSIYDGQTKEELAAAAIGERDRKYGAIFDPLHFKNVTYTDDAWFEAGAISK
jgi:hypothetical protein